jgi:hypothetical protein
MHLAPGAGDRCGERHSPDLLVYRVRRNRDSIEAHLAIVFARLAVTRFTEGRIGRSVKKFARIARRYRAVQIRADRHALTAEDPPPPGLRNALAHIKQQERGTH